jgi:hypothetical protein
MAFVSIHLEGGLFPPDLLEDLAAETLREGQRPEDFGLPAGQSLQAEISEAWGAALQHWKAFQRSLLRHQHGGSAGVSLTTLTRNWVQSFLAELGYELVYQPRAADLDGRSYAISHRAGPDAAAPPVHIVSCELQLDEKPPSGRPRLSAHALVQEYCNRSEHLWGLATNGLRLRVIRDAAHVSHPTYLEFSLQQLFEGELFSEFVLLFRLLHRTRLPATAATASECWLERYYQTGLERGGRARERIREGVEEALRRFGAGFLRHEANEELRAALRTGRLDAAGYYQELLRLVYRLLFLLVAEERGLAGPEDPRLAAIYREHYSVSRLRPLVEQPIGLEEQWHDDLWQSLLVTFQAYTDRAVAEALDMHPLDGELFSHDALRFLERCRLHNADLLAAFHGLSLYREDKGRLRRVNYAHLDVEELGSIYEALLDYTPVVDPDQHADPFRFVAGTERKSTGSYYTPHELVQELITRALDPVMADRLSGARTPQEQERALLSLRVCDPATGSGHFLLAAARRIARELARVRTGEDEPDAASYRAALRDVVSHCLYGVDVNPLAVELCRVALWIESHDRGKPLTFLDHRIHCGDSLVGVFDLKVLEEGIPDGAYDPVAGDDRALARDLKKRNRQERERQPTLFPSTTPPAEQLAELSKRLAAVAALPERTIQEREAKQQAYQSLRDSQLCRDLTTAADLWTAAFFLPMQKAVLSRFSGSAELGLTTATVWRYLADGSVRGDLVGEAIALARRIRAFHWPLAFPDVFEAGGFDVVLGNPPWDVQQVEEIAYFAQHLPWVAQAPTQAERARRIAKLRAEGSPVVREFDQARAHVSAFTRFARSAGRFEHSAEGKLNLYALFAELAHALLNRSGRAGVIVPTNIATDNSTRHLFGQFVSTGALVSLCDFENRQGLFPAVDSRYRFSLLTLSGSRAPAVTFAFFCTHPRHLQDGRRVYTLTAGDFALFNPNTRTAPTFRTRADAELARKIYQRVPVLVREGDPAGNPWGVTLRQGLFNMSSDSALFRDAPGPGLVPLYEAKLFHQFDHRWATYAATARGRAGAEARDCTDAEKADPTFQVVPRYWVPRPEVEARLEQAGWRRGWLLAFRDITNATNERTVIATVLPRLGVGHKAPLIIPRLDMNSTGAPSLLGLLNSLVLDYVARTKVGGTSLGFFILRQFPVLPPQAYGSADLTFIVPRVLELVYTAWDLRLFAADVWQDAGDELRLEILLRWEEATGRPAPAEAGPTADAFCLPPFPWNPDRRAVVRAELDACYARLYGLTEEELRYILDPADVYGPDFPGETFRVLKEREMRQYGEYRTRRLVLEAWERLQSRAAGPVSAAQAAQ